jgi:hypothetical protein
MLPGDWTTFFGIIVGAATGLAGLLFVAFSIYVANRQIDSLACDLAREGSCATSGERRGVAK